MNPGGLPGFCVWLQFLLYSALLFPTSFHGQNLCPPHCRLRDTPEQGTPWHAGRSLCFLSSPAPAGQACASETLRARPVTGPAHLPHPGDVGV